VEGDKRTEKSCAEAKAERNIVASMKTNAPEAERCAQVQDQRSPARDLEEAEEEEGKEMRLRDRPPYAVRDDSLKVGVCKSEAKSPGRHEDNASPGQDDEGSGNDEAADGEFDGPKEGEEEGENESMAEVVPRSCVS